MNRIERIAEKVAATRLAAIHTYKVGDIFYSMWGYDQTNVDWYQVTAVGEKSVKIREIQGKRVGGSTGSDSMMPVPNAWAGPEMLRIVNSSGYLKINSSSYAEPWDGNPKEQTAAGYGH